MGLERLVSLKHTPCVARAGAGYKWWGRRPYYSIIPALGPLPINSMVLWPLKFYGGISPTILIKGWGYSYERINERLALPYPLGPLNRLLLWD